MGRIETRLAELGIELPTSVLVARANALYWKHAGQLVFVGGGAPVWNGEIVITGRLGQDLTVEDGKEAARLSALNILYFLKEACDGNLDRVKSCVMLNAFVRCTDDFSDQPLVINGASDLIVDVFGEAGRHTRHAIGSNALPRDIPVELAGVFEIEQ